MVEFKDGYIFARGDSEDSVLDMLSVAGFSALPPKGSVERFKRFGRTFERTSAFLSDGEFCFVLKEV